MKNDLFWQCPQCGSKNSNLIKFCPNCDYNHQNLHNNNEMDVSFYNHSEKYDNNFTKNNEKEDIEEIEYIDLEELDKEDDFDDDDFFKKEDDFSSIKSDFTETSEIFQQPKKTSIIREKLNVNPNYDNHKKNYSKTNKDDDIFDLIIPSSNNHNLTDDQKEWNYKFEMEEGDTYIRANEPFKALECYINASMILPDVVLPYLKIAKIYLALNHFAKASLNYLKVLSIDPINIEALKGLKFIELQTKMSHAQKPISLDRRENSYSNRKKRYRRKQNILVDGEKINAIGTMFLLRGIVELIFAVVLWIIILSAVIGSSNEISGLFANGFSMFISYATLIIEILTLVFIIWGFSPNVEKGIEQIILILQLVCFSAFLFTKIFMMFFNEYLFQQSDGFMFSIIIVNIVGEFLTYIFLLILVIIKPSLMVNRKYGAFIGIFIILGNNLLYIFLDIDIFLFGGILLPIGFDIIVLCIPGFIYISLAARFNFNLSNRFEDLRARNTNFNGYGYSRRRW